MDTVLEIKSLLLKKAELILRALNHPIRQRIIDQIHNNKEIGVADIQECLQVEQTVLSQHLAILRKAGFVYTRKEGKQVFYTINYERLEQVQANIKGLLL